MIDKRVRIEKNLNREWKFIHGDIEKGYLPEYDASGWYDIGLPHTFSMPYWGESSFYVGYGMYRKILLIEEGWQDKNIYLEFGAAFQDAQIYINGQLVGEHKGGYTAFVVEITGAVHQGENLIAVRLNNLWCPTIAPRAGEHTFCGGLYRDVKLIVVNKLHTAWHGTFITTPQVNENFATIQIETEIENTSPTAQKVTVQTTLLSSERHVIKTLIKVQTLQPHTTQIVTQETYLEQPDLWAPEHPALYRAITQLFVNYQSVDDYDTSFGIRWFEFTKDKGFWLNGKPVYLQGANVHQDHAGWGDAVTHTGIARDIKLMKDCGMNFIRGSHYPHHLVFAQECDKQGLLFWSELCFWGIGGFVDEGYWFASAFPTRKEDYNGFEESCITTLKEMIRTHRNRPSIITWSMGNEMFFSKDEVMEDAKDLIHKLVEVSHQEDRTRPASVGGVQRCGFDALGDIAGYNGDGAVLYKDPGFPSLVAEYGSIPDSRPGKYDLYLSEGSEELYSWRSGRAIWCGFHHGSIANIGNLGIVDLYRLPLRAWYCYREHLLGIKPPEWPQEGIPHHIEITTDSKKIKNDGTQDCQLVIALYDKENRRTNQSPDIKLSIISGPGYFPTGKTLILSKEKGSFIEGIGSIELRAYYAGVTRIEAKAEGLKEASIEIITTGDEAYTGEKLNLPPLPLPYIYEQVEDNTINLAKNRPCKVSSENKDFLRHYGNSEDKSTYWLSKEEDKEPWWQIDLENIYALNQIQIELSTTEKNKIILEKSHDAVHWLGVGSATLVAEIGILEMALTDCVARYIRVTLPQTKKRVGLKLFKAFGKTYLKS